MKTVVKIVGIVLLAIFAIPSLRNKVLNLLFPPKYEKGISYEEVQKATEKYKKEHGLPIKTFTSSGMKVHLYSIDEWTPKNDNNKLDAQYAHYLVVKASVENSSTQEVEAGMFNTTFFLEDNEGNLSHCRLEDFVGFYEEQNIQPDDALIKSYYAGKIAPATTLQPKLFFFPMRANTTAVKVHFDDWTTKEQMEFNL